MTRADGREPWDAAVAWRLRPAGDAAIETAPGARSRSRSEPRTRGSGRNAKEASTVPP